MLRILGALALLVAIAAPPGRGEDEKVASDTIARSDATGTYLVLSDGTELYVPRDLPLVVRTELGRGRAVKAYYRAVDGRNVVPLMFTVGMHPGAGG